MTLLRPGRKRQCAKGKHSWHDVDAAWDGYNFNAPVEVCSKCGKWVGLIDKHYRNQAIELLRKPLIFDKLLSGAATIGSYVYGQQKT